MDHRHASDFPCVLPSSSVRHRLLEIIRPYVLGQFRFLKSFLSSSNIDIRHRSVLLLHQIVVR